MDGWQTMDSAPKDGSVVSLYCPGACKPTNGVLQGCWNTRLGLWTLNPYGTTQFVTLYPSMWCALQAPPS